MEIEAERGLEELKRMEKELSAVENAQRERAREMEARMPAAQRPLRDEEDGDEEEEWDDEPSPNHNHQKMANNNSKSANNNAGDDISAVAIYDYQAGRF